MINHKIYIGSSIDVKRRICSHKYQLINNKHHNYHLQKSINKYNIDNFEFNIIEECLEEDLLKREEYYIKFYNADNIKHGYNIGSFEKGRKIHSNETKLKISCRYLLK